MSRKRRRRAPPGTSPGQLAVDPGAPRPLIRLIGYGPAAFEERDIRNTADIRAALTTHAVTWVDVSGLGDTGVITEIGNIFKLHRLALEDVVNLHQRAKTEPYPGHQYVVARMPERRGETLDLEQLSLFVGANYVLSFQVTPGDCFDRIRERIRQGRQTIRGGGPGYLAYAILDAIIDAYFPIVEGFSDELEGLEDKVLETSDPRVVARLHCFKQDLLSIKRAIWQMRDMLGPLSRDESAIFNAETRIYLRDCYDHTIQLVEISESLRESCSSLIELYLSAASNRMNEVMKVLTIIATIFIPLSFVAGLWGMNFNTEKSPFNMPELNWYFGYPLALIIMAAVAVAMLIYFKKKGWLG